jgi:hypothetical protein
VSNLPENVHRIRKSWLGVGAATAALVALAGCSSDSDAPATVASSSSAPTSATTATSSPTSTSPAATSPSTTPSGAATNPFLSGPETVDAAADVEIEDQSGAGTEVLVDRVRLSSGAGHVAIFTATGQLLGSAAVSDGATSVTVPLDPPVAGSGELIGVLYGGGDSSFELGVTPRIVDEDGDAETEDFDYRLN